MDEKLETMCIGTHGDFSSRYSFFYGLCEQQCDAGFFDRQRQWDSVGSVDGECF